jgi:hypothetical protein
MKLTQEDIGGEIVSILTKGMYADPRDALREYVQNGVDAGTPSINIKIRNDSIVVQDFGRGMDWETMRNAVRLGVSDKNPKDSVGFMGIGLYSSFHLCAKLEIYSKTETRSPNRIVFDFLKMRQILDGEREARFNKKQVKRTALLELLERTVNVEELTDDDFPVKGTRVEMTGIERHFFDSLSQFDDVSQYLEQVIPLPFHKDFQWGDAIQERIKIFCEKHGTPIRFVDLKLSINDRTEEIYRPYLDKDFSELPLEPKYHELKNSDGTFGIAWGCLNKDRMVFDNKNIDYRGFIIKKQGFSIGNRHDLTKFFGGSKYFNRYIGEIIVTHPSILPNAPRSEFEYSALRESFFSALIDVAKKFNTYATQYQENQIGAEQLADALKTLKSIKANYGFYQDKTDKLLEYIIILTTQHDEIKRKINKKKFVSDDEARKVIELINDQINELKNYIEVKKRTYSSKKTAPEIVEEVEAINELEAEAEETPMQEEPESLVALLNHLDFSIPKEMRIALEIIDEYFIQETPSLAESYAERLQRLKKEIEDAFLR